MNNLIDRFSNKTTLFILSGIIFLSSLVVLSLFQSAKSSISKQQKAVTLTREMIKSSDDLTNYGRYFVVTKRSEWKDEFNKALDVRNGVAADSNGVKKAFKDKLKESGIFINEETDILLKAEELSNNLAKIENEAFKLIDLWKKEEKYSEYQLGLELKAKMLVFGEDYVKYKKEIDDTSISFYNNVVNRLKTDYERSMFLAWSFITVINVALLMLVVGIMHFKQATKSVVAKKPGPAKKVAIRKPAIRR